MKDPAFLSDAEKARLDLDPITGEEVEAIIKQAYSTPKDLIARAAELNK